jgi:hypothetical protein
MEKYPDIQFVIMLGDNVYNNGDPKDYKKKFEQPYKNLLDRKVPFYASLGNHDYKHGNWKHAIGFPLFNMNGKRYYKFPERDDLVEFFVLDSNRLCGGCKDAPEQEQLNWLKEELAKSAAKWKIVYFHHPIYSSGGAPWFCGHGSDEKMRCVLEPHLIKGGVRVVFSGHDHHYERIGPKHDIAYFVSGAAGKLCKENIRRETGLTVCGNDRVRHFMYLEVNEQKLAFEAISEGGDTIDKGTIPLNPNESIQAECKGNAVSH